MKAAKPKKSTHPVADLLAKRGGWCQGAFARNRRRKEVSIDDEGACSFCLEGAIRHVYGRSGEDHDAANVRINKELQKIHFRGSNMHFNDMPGRKKSEVLAVLRKARV